MYYNHSKFISELFEPLNKQIRFINSIPENNLKTIRQSISLANQYQQVLNSSLIYQKINIVSPDFKIPKVPIMSNLVVLNTYNFQRNLFSERPFENFIKSANFSNEVVFKAQQILRNYYVESTGFSTLVKPFDSADPIVNQPVDRKDNHTKSELDIFIHNLNTPPLKKINTGLKHTSTAIIVADFGNFVTNSINEDDLHIENSIFCAVISLVLFLSTFNLKKLE